MSSTAKLHVCNKGFSSAAVEKYPDSLQTKFDKIDNRN